VEVKERIIITSKELFHKYGIRSVKMDDVAKELTMSKKTLYQYFKDKDELVDETTLAHIKRERKEFEEISQNSENAIEELFKVSKCLRVTMNEINPTLLYDLKRYYPNSWKYWLDFKEDYVFVSIVENMKKGINAGYFRENIDPQVMAILRVLEVEMLFDIDTFPSSEFDYRHVQLQLFHHFVFGIATEKGRKLYQQYLETEKDEVFVQ
jgi:AcrR family transcriptional regulator